MPKDPIIALEFQCKLTSNELLLQLTLGERLDLLHEMAGGSHIPIDQMRRIVLSPGYDDPVVKEDAK